MSGNSDGECLFSKCDGSRQYDSAGGCVGSLTDPVGNRDTSGTHLEMKLWDIYYPEGWTENEDYKGDSETNSYGRLDYKQGEETLLAVSISATVEDCNDYRDFLYVRRVLMPMRWQ